MRRTSFFSRFLQAIRATKRYGDEDVWDFILNSSQAFAEYVHVRDFDRRLNFSGWVSAFSLKEEFRELLLRDVEVTDFEGDVLYNTPRVYISMPKEGLLIEFPFSQEQQDAEPE